MPTIAGLVLAPWFVQMALVPGPVGLETIVVAAIAVAMISAGIRYIFKSPPKKKKTPPNVLGEGSGT